MEKILIKSNIESDKTIITQPTPFDVIITSAETFFIGLIIGYMLRKLLKNNKNI